MDLYYYTLGESNTFTCHKRKGFEERDNSYIMETGRGGSLTILKDNVDIVRDALHMELCLTEADGEKAKKMMRDHCLEMISHTKENQDKICSMYQKIIDDMR